MYETPTGIRTLEGAERRLYMESLSVATAMLSCAESVFGVPPFDDLSNDAKLKFISAASFALLVDSPTTTERCPEIDAAIAAVLSCATSMIQAEIDDIQVSQWRFLVRRTAEQTGVAAPPLNSRLFGEWTVTMRGILRRIVSNDSRQILRMQPRDFRFSVN